MKKNNKKWKNDKKSDESKYGDISECGYVFAFSSTFT